MDNYLFVGPPGSGKTYKAKECVVKLFYQNSYEDFKAIYEIRRKPNIEKVISDVGVNTLFCKLREQYPERVCFISLHEGYAYTDLVEGFEISASAGVVKWILQSKIIKKVVDYAQEKSKDVFIILDDIDRVDITSVLGEYIFAITHAGEQITDMFGGTLCVSEKVHFIGTYNPVAARSDSSQDLYRCFNQIKHIKYNKNDLSEALDALSNSSYDKNELDLQKKKINQLFTWYDEVVNENLTYEYREHKNDYRLGISYFLPPRGTDVYDFDIVSKNRVHHQVRPLFEQYIKDGILSRKALPPEAWTYTLFTRNKDEVLEPNIIIEYDKRKDNINGKTLAYYTHQLFDCGKYIISEKCKNFRIGTAPDISRGYMMVFVIIEDIIRHNLLNEFELIQMWQTDFSISFATGMNEEKGCLINLKDNNFRIGDKTKKNTQNHYDYHTLIYNHNEYMVEGRFAYTSMSLPLEIEKCYSDRNKNTEKVNPYTTVKMIVYRYLSRYVELLKEYKDSEDCNDKKSVEAEILSVNKDIQKVVALTFDNKKMSEPGYINPGKNAKSSKAYYLMVKYIRDLPTWRNMINGSVKGVYKKMDTEYMKIMDMTGIKQMVLQGPPGTSKTYSAKRIIAEALDIEVDATGGLDLDTTKKALNNHKLLIDSDTKEYTLPSITDGKEVYWEMIQFHPAYTYEDFIRGISVDANKSGKNNGVINDDSGNKVYDFSFDSGMSYEVINKTFGRICNVANRPENKNKKFFLVIDEINRANLASVFGELIYALEYRDEPVTTPYKPNSEKSNDICVPGNLYIIGTMNTADKSIGGIDYAIRRRFLFYPVLPDSNVVYGSVNGDEKSAELKLFYLMEKIFSTCINENDFNVDDVQIGHTYFIRDDSKGFDVMEYKFYSQIVPILNEYLKDGVIKKRALSDVYEGKVIDIMGKKNGSHDAYEELLSIIESDSSFVDRLQEYKKKWERVNS